MLVVKNFLCPLLRIVPNLSVIIREIGPLPNDGLPLDTQLGRNRASSFNKKFLVNNSSQGHVSSGNLKQDPTAAQL